MRIVVSRTWSAALEVARARRGRGCERCGSAMHPTHLWCPRCGHALGAEPGARIPTAEELLAGEVELYERELQARLPSERRAWLHWLLGGWWGLHRLRFGQTELALLQLLLAAVAITSALGLQVDGRAHAWLPLALLGALWAWEGFHLRWLLRASRERAR